MKLTKINWFKVLMWGIFFLILYSWISFAIAIYHGETICQQDDIYDNNCGD